MTDASSFDSQALAGRVAVVTGAAGGLGLAITQRLHAMGAQVVQVDVAFAAEPAANAQGLALGCDLADPQAIADLGQRVKEGWGRCDILVNNAAVSAPAVPLEDFPADQWDRIFGINLKAALLCAQALVPMMFEREAGCIINVASIAARSATRVAAYGPAKAGLLGLTQQMAIEWGPRGIRTNSISPGLIRTPLSEDFYRDPAQLQARVSKVPVRRIGRPMDIGDAVGFLASDAAQYINGQDLTVDGGFMKASLFNLYG